MRTIRCSGRLGGWSLPRAGVYPAGACLPRGVYTSPRRGQTDACEKITFPQLLLRTVNMILLTSFGLCYSNFSVEKRFKRFANCLVRVM